MALLPAKSIKKFRFTFAVIKIAVCRLCKGLVKKEHCVVLSQNSYNDPFMCLVPDLGIGVA